MAPNLKSVRAILLDIDGIMTDGSIIVDADGGPLRIFNEKDGHGLRMAAMAGYFLGVITGGSTDSVRKRMTAYGVPFQHIYLKVRDKLKAIRSICDDYGFAPEEVLYMGDDIPDVAALQFAGVAVVPSDAVEEAKEVADIISPVPGGRGFVRWVLELVMKEQDKWHFDVDKYEKLF